MNAFSSSTLQRPSACAHGNYRRETVHPQVCGASDVHFGPMKAGRRTYKAVSLDSAEMDEGTLPLRPLRERSLPQPQTFGEHRPSQRMRARA